MSQSGIFRIPSPCFGPFDSMAPSRVFPSDIAYKLAGYQPVGNNTGQPYPSTSTATDTTNNTMNTRRLVNAPLSTGLTDIVLAFPGFGLIFGGAAEANIPTAYTVTAAIEYPIGSTPRQVFFGGAASATVNPGRLLVKTDPFPVYIPAGAQFAIKCFVSWTPGTMWLIGGLSATYASYDWTTRGTGLTDQTLTAQSTGTTTTQNMGFSPIILGRPIVHGPVVGILGDSIMQGLNDQTETVSVATSMMRAMRGSIPAFCNSVGGYAMGWYLQRREGQNLVLRDSITHLLMELCVNDINAGVTLGTMQSNWQAIVNPFLARGVKVYGWTCTPKSSSSNGFIDTANQSVANSANETVRLNFNAWLRTNQTALGLSGLIDAAHAIDPGDTGLWGVDAGAVSGTSGATGFATVVGGVVTAVSASTGLGVGLQPGVACGAGYPNSTSFSWVAAPYPGQTGAGAYGTATSNGSGQILTWTVTNGGSGYSAAPMINLRGLWTMDGLHPTPRGYNEIIAATGIGPGMFAL